MQPVIISLQRLTHSSLNAFILYSLHAATNWWNKQGSKLCKQENQEHACHTALNDVVALLLLLLELKTKMFCILHWFGTVSFLTCTNELAKIMAWAHKVNSLHLYEMKPFRLMDPKEFDDDYVLYGACARVFNFIDLTYCCTKLHRILPTIMRKRQDTVNEHTMSCYVLCSLAKKILYLNVFLNCHYHLAFELYIIFYLCILLGWNGGGRKLATCVSSFDNEIRRWPVIFQPISVQTNNIFVASEFDENKIIFYSPRFCRLFLIKTYSLSIFGWSFRNQKI